MKHIKKKFLNEVKISKEVVEKLDSMTGHEPVTTEMMNSVKIPKNSIPYFIAEDAMYTGFQVKINGRKRIVPEPDPILIYYHTAYANYKSLEESKNKLIQRTEQTIGSEPAINELYDYFGLVSCVVIFLFNAVEATMNRCIPDNYIKTKTLNTKTETYSKGQIERYFSFENKLKVLEEITNKNFHRAMGIKYQHLINLKNFRDAIVHTKSENEGDTAENHNYKKAFSFDFTEAMIAVKEFCNFYLNDDFIIECSCSLDW